MAAPAKPSAPFYVRILRITYRILDLIWPYLAARIAFKIWFLSPRFKEPRRERHWRKLALTENFEINTRQVKYYRWGATTPGYVLFIHGWSGRGGQAGGFVNAVNHAGLGMISFDAPGHGQSDGNSTNIYELVNTAEEIIKKYGAPKAIIAHSFGGLVSALLLRKSSIPTNKLVMISSPKKTMLLILGYQSYMKISDRIMRHFHKMMYDRFSSDIYQDISTDHNLKQLNINLLLIHDKDDKIVGWEQTRSLAEELKKNNQNPQVLLTTNLGHNRILWDRQVIDESVRFILQDS